MHRSPTYKASSLARAPARPMPHPQSSSPRLRVSAVNLSQGETHAPSRNTVFVTSTLYKLARLSGVSSTSGAA